MIDAKKYLFVKGYPREPSIVEVNGLDELSLLVSKYTNTDTVNYVGEVEEYTANKIGIRTRFMYDVLGDLEGNKKLALIDLSTNKVEMNIKANELWEEATRNERVDTVTGMNRVIANVGRLIAILEAEGGGSGLVVTDTEPEVDYDTLAVEITYDEDPVYFYIDDFSKSGRDLTYTGANGETISWSGSKNGWLLEYDATEYLGSDFASEDATGVTDVLVWAEVV